MFDSGDVGRFDFTRCFVLNGSLGPQMGTKQRGKGVAFYVGLARDVGSFLCGFIRWLELIGE